MDYEHIKILLKDNYDIKVNEIEKVKNTYKIKSTNEEYCLKVIKYQYPHFYFIISAIEHLQRNGFKYTPNIINTNDDINYISLDNKYAYLTPWIKCREADYDNKDDLKKASQKLSELHNCSEGFKINELMEPRVGWSSWVNVFETRSKEILDFKKQIYRKDRKTEFDLIYLSIMKEELELIERTLNNLKSSDYFTVMNNEILKNGFCHHDYAHHNVLIDDKDQVNIIDFDYCILDTSLHDLSSLCIRTMKDGKWDIETFNYIISNYSTFREINQNHIPIMAAFIQFPQFYWQIGIQYYWEEHIKGDDVFIKRLNKYINDRKMREEFVNELRQFILR